MGKSENGTAPGTGLDTSGRGGGIGKAFKLTADGSTKGWFAEEFDIDGITPLDGRKTPLAVELLGPLPRPRRLIGTIET